MMPSIEALTSVAREQALYEEARAGRIQLEWYDVPVGDRLVLTVSNPVRWSDGVRYGVSSELQSRLALLADALLPTPAIVDHVVRHAAVRIGPPVRPAATIQRVSTMRDVSAAIDRQIAGQTGLLGGGWKSWTLGIECWTAKDGGGAPWPGLNYGYHYTTDEVRYASSYGRYVVRETLEARGTPVRAAVTGSPYWVIQSPGHYHNVRHADSSQLAILVRRRAQLDGQPIAVVDLYVHALDLAVCRLVAPTPLPGAEHPASSRLTTATPPAASPPTTTRPSSDTTPITSKLPALGQRVLRRPMRVGADIAYVQRRVGLDPRPTTWTTHGGVNQSWPAAWAWPLDVDEDYGERTEAAVMMWQARRQLTVDGEVGMHETWPRLLAEEAGRVVVPWLPRPTGTPSPTKPPAVIATDSRYADLWIAAHPARYLVASRDEDDVGWAVLHCTQNPPHRGIARNVATYFASPPRNPKDVGSAHWITGPEISIQCVRTKDVAYSAPACNRYGEHFELTGYAETTNWFVSSQDDPEHGGLEVIERVAPLLVDRMLARGIPFVALDAEAVVAGQKGLFTHATGTEACQLAKSRGIQEPPWYDFTKREWKYSDHRDPALQHDARWDWDRFLAILAQARQARGVL